MAFLWVGVALATLLFLYILLKKQEPPPTAFKGRACEPLHLRKDPYILGIYGIIHAIKDKVAGRLPLSLIDLFSEYGHTFGINVFGVRSIMTRDPRNIQAMLATQFEDFGLAHGRRALNALLGTQGIFTQDGADWKASRALLRPSFDRASVADLSALEIFVTRMIAKINASAGSDGYHEVDLLALLLELTMDAATDFLFGSPIGAQEGKASVEGEMSFSEAFDISQQVISTRSILHDLYWLVNPKRFVLATKIVHKLVGHYVALALQKHNNSGGGEDRPYTKESSTSGKYIFLDALSHQTQDPQVLQDQLLSVIMAGRDTTASSLTWAFHALSRHPTALQKLRREVLETVGTRPPTQADLRKMVYLRHFLHEVLRMYPPVGVNSRSALRATTLPHGGGADGEAPVAVRKGERVFYSVFALHRREDIYGPDAGAFRPERWEGEEAAAWRAAWAWLPFNGGPRVCLGMQMALTQVGYVLVRVLQAFEEVEGVGEEGEEGEERYKLNLIMVPKEGLRVKMR